MMLTIDPLPDIPLLQVDFFVEEHAGDHLEVRGVVGDKEFVFAFSLVIQELIFH